MVEYGFESKDNEIFPSMIQAMINNTCNLSCNHCPHPEYRNSPEYRPTYMKLSLFQRIIDETSEHKNASIRIFGWGEPLKHPQLTDMVKYAGEKNVPSILITNGTLLSQDISHKLLDYKLSIIEISLDAASPETYELVRGNKKTFQKVVENVNTLLKLRNEQHNPLYVVLSIINQPKASEDVPKFIEQWSEKVDKVLTRRFHDFMGAAADKSAICLPERYPCRALWSRFNITPEGLVSICYNDWKNEYIIGNLNDTTQSIKAIWNSDIYKKYRESHLSKEYFGLCAKCNTWIGSDWKTPYEVLIKESKRKHE